MWTIVYGKNNGKSLAEGERNKLLHNKTLTI